jgi:hypothetical protein
MKRLERNKQKHYFFVDVKNIKNKQGQNDNIKKIEMGAYKDGYHVNSKYWKS